MSTWILILWSVSWVGHFAAIHSVRFQSKVACEAALRITQKEDSDLDGVCVEDSAALTKASE